MTAHKRISAAKEIAFSAVTCALLIGGQYAFSFVSGVEIVTVLLACFAYAAGVRAGVLCAVAFSLLRCFIFGFSPNVILLYLLYYPAFAAAFGALGKIRQQTYATFPWPFALIVNLLLILVAVSCVCACCFGLFNSVSRVIRATLVALSWTIFALSAALLIAFDILLVLQKAFEKNTAAALKLLTVTTVATVFTVLFTLLDDLISPLMLGYSSEGWLAYFYASFTAVLPQTVCTVATVTTLFLPLTKLFETAVKF